MVTAELLSAIGYLEASYVPHWHARPQARRIDRQLPNYKYISIRGRAGWVAVGLKPSASVTKATFVACRLGSCLCSLAKRGFPNRVEIPVLFRNVHQRIAHTRARMNSRPIACITPLRLNPPTTGANALQSYAQIAV